MPHLVEQRPLAARVTTPAGTATRSARLHVARTSLSPTASQFPRDWSRRPETAARSSRIKRRSASRDLSHVCYLMDADDATGDSTLDHEQLAQRRDNHGEKGFNVAYMDCHVEWTARPARDARGVHGRLLRSRSVPAGDLSRNTD